MRTRLLLFTIFVLTANLLLSGCGQRSNKDGRQGTGDRNTTQGSTEPSTAANAEPGRSANKRSTAGTSKVLFEVKLEDVPSGGRICEVTFYGKPPLPAIVDKILRASLESAILVDDSTDILAIAFLGDETMNSNQHSGSLVYKAAGKRILTKDEWRGVKTSASSTDSYYVEVREEGTLP